MTNDECKVKVEKHVPGGAADSIDPFHICAFSRNEAIDGLEDDSCQVYCILFKDFLLFWLILTKLFKKIPTYSVIIN